MIRFLIKAAFWLTIVVLLLPRDPARRESGAQVGPVEAIEAAQAAVEDASTFCERRPEACEVGAQAFQTFGEKAQHGAKLLYEFLSARFAETPSAPREVRVRRTDRPLRDTLTPADLAIPWQGRSEIPLPPRRPA